MVMQGVPIFTGSKALGHSSVLTTARHYAHLAPDHLRDAVDAIETMEKTGVSASLDAK